MAIRETAHKYKGLTKRAYKRTHGSGTPGTEKGENCHATAMDKAMAKYPRAYKSMPAEYRAWCLKKDRADGKRGISLAAIS